MADTSDADRSSVTLNVCERPARFSNDLISDSFPDGTERISNTRYVEDEPFRASRSSDVRYSEEAATARFSNNQVQDDQQSLRFSDNQILDQRQSPRFSDTQAANESRIRLVQSPNTDEPVQSWAQANYHVKQPDVLEPILSALKDVCDAAGGALPRIKDAIFQAVPGGSMMSQQKESINSILNTCDAILAYTRATDEFISRMSDPKLENRMAHVDQLQFYVSRVLKSCFALFNKIETPQGLGFDIQPLIIILRPLSKVTKHAVNIWRGLNSVDRSC